MKTFELPFLTSTSSLPDAVAMMKKHNTRALVTELAGVHRLVTNRDLKDVYPRRDATLADVKSLTIDQAQGVETNAPLAIVSVIAGMASLLSDQESIARILNATKVCVCTKDHSHTKDSPPAKDGEPCEFGDGHYECF